MLPLKILTMFLSIFEVKALIKNLATSKDWLDQFLNMEHGRIGNTGTRIFFWEVSLIFRRNLLVSKSEHYEPLGFFQLDSYKRKDLVTYIHQVPEERAENCAQVPNSTCLQDVDVERNCEPNEDNVAERHAGQEEVGGRVHRLVHHYHYHNHQVAWNKKFI